MQDIVERLIYCFLSCLYGSEGKGEGDKEDANFLSYLYGSEALQNVFSAPLNFLSCLYGSEVISLRVILSA